MISQCLYPWLVTVDNPLRLMSNRNSVKIQILSLRKTRTDRRTDFNSQQDERTVGGQTDDVYPDGPSGYRKSDDFQMRSAGQQPVTDSFKRMNSCFQSTLSSISLLGMDNSYIFTCSFQEGSVNAGCWIHTEPSTDYLPNPKVHHYETCHNNPNAAGNDDTDSDLMDAIEGGGHTHTHTGDTDQSEDTASQHPIPGKYVQQSST